MVLNDDIVIPVWLCEELLKWLGNAKISCPYTTIGRDKFCLPMNKKVGNIAGWCFMMRKSDYAPIPDELDLWFGDDWLYHKMWESVYYWGICHHYESKTINRPDQRNKFKKESEKTHKIGILFTLTISNMHAPRTITLSDGNWTKKWYSYQELVINLLWRRF